MLIILAAIVLLLLVLIFRPWNRRNCRWREDRRHPGPEVRHICAACGSELWLPEGKTPKSCLAGRQNTRK